MLQSKVSRIFIVGLILIDLKVYCNHRDSHYGIGDLGLFTQITFSKVVSRTI